MQNYYNRNNENFDPYKPTKAQWMAIIIGFIAIVVLILTSCSNGPSEPIRDITDTSRPQMFSSIDDSAPMQPIASAPIWSPTAIGIEKLKRTFDATDGEITYLLYLSEAFAEVESELNQIAYNPKSKATGLHQITPIMLQEYNSRANDSLTISDIYDPRVSSYIFCYMQLSSNRNLSITKACQVWNPHHSKAYLSCIQNLVVDNMEGGVE